jgi:hypothetical protein
MRITGQNLDETIKINREISREVQEQIKYLEKYLKRFRINSTEKQAMQILKEHNLIQVPIPDLDWGGAIYELPNGQKVPVINTAQPRLYQYFICWHEIYHLTEESKQNTTHSISTEFDLTERKADYFASQMLIGNDLYSYYSDLKDDEFINRVAYCMDIFKAPYKAILIQLYEEAIQFKDSLLQSEIKTYFDLKLDQKQWEQKFKELSLDDTLVKPTGIIDFGKLKKFIEEKIVQHSDVELYSKNMEFLLALENKLRDSKEAVD